jgi:CubicO group peptidase (beta-lactamase class C family)
MWGLVGGMLVAGCGPAETETTTASTGGTAGKGGAGGAPTTGGAGGSGGEGGAVDPRFDALIAAVLAEREELGAPGVAIAVIEDGEVSFARGFGSKDPAADVPVEATTLFRIGSVNKMLTAAGLLVQVGKGAVDLGEPVTELVPAFHFDADPAWAPSITGEHLLTHTSGMVDYLDMTVPAAQKTDEALETFMTGQFGSVGYLMAPAGAFYNYSNPGFYLAGLLAEKAAGKPYRQLMKEDVFAPLGMDRTFFLGSEVLADGDYAIGKSGGFAGLPDTIHPDTYDNAWARPAGFASSSVLDLAKFVRYLLDGDSAVMPDALVEGMQSPHVNMLEYGDLLHYGHGLMIFDGVFLGGPDKYHSMKVVQHGGDIPGFAALVAYVPSTRFGFIALANADGATFTNSLVTALTTLTKLPEPSTPPDLTVDPSTFTALEGTYEDNFNVGTITVTKVGDSLEVNMPAVDQAGVPYEPILTPYAPDSFYLDIQGFTLPVRVIPDEGGVYRYLRTRAFVGIRPSAPPPPPASALTVDRRARLLDAIRRAAPSAVEQLARPQVR